MVDEGPALLEFGLILAHHVRSHPICREGSPSEVGSGVGWGSYINTNLGETQFSL